jgi:hypothetical protein
MDRPRNHDASPFYTLVSDYFYVFEEVYAGRFQPKYGFWRPIIRTAKDKSSAEIWGRNLQGCAVLSVAGR